ncbi:phenol hydroxylase subunit P4 [Ferribacterium limneticum]|uniref:phenol hydroxylase subunit P4 n=1 Tax=Ferribacterium limneticum TaxID=76259 RepID=UPI001CF7F7FC|nr:phenol hydroxylase subunit P4 [Ferribacterium limneticum]UCV24307.1 phenol hydroxylase subunit P4 [Ferribacterium limneticum]
MALTSTKPYVAVPRDLVENFNGKQIVYVCWDHHMLFATPLMLVVEPGMSFGDLLENVVKPLIGPDPDAAAVDLSTVEWLKSGRAWGPDLAGSLAENGIVHKEQLRFRTPGVNSLLAAA